MNASNVGPIRGPLAVAGVPVTAASPVPAARPGRRQGLVTLGGLGPTASAGFTVPGPGAADLAARWLAEIATLEHAAGIAPVQAVPAAATG